MDTIFSEHLSRMIADWQGPKLCLTVTGGGIGLADILKIPGSSRIIHNIEIPYSNESQANLAFRDLGIKIDIENWKSVSADAVKMFVEASKARHGDQYAHVAVSAALSTMRYDPVEQQTRARRGINHAYVAISDGRMFHITLEKLTNEQVEAILPFPVMMRNVRQKEDSRITLAVISLLLNNPGIMPKWSEYESCVSI